MAKSKTSKRILFIVGAVLCCIFAVILVCNLTIIIKGVVNPKVPPSVFGVTPMVVQSGSMSGNAEDHIEVGDLIFTVKPDTDKLKAGEKMTVNVPAEVDKEVAERKLRYWGITIDKLTEEQEKYLGSWEV